jgi:diguanylate cyclase (GGDEF)-like protein
LGWLECENKRQIKELPWIQVLQEGVELKSASLSLLDNQGSTIKLIVNASAVTDNTGKPQGCLATFSDITQMEEKNLELNHLVEKLQLSQWEINSKNKELEFLANSDPLTLCLNRRSLDREFDAIFNKAKTIGMDLSCLMIDIDLFKSVNDRYGHATGDLVIKSVADVLKTCTRDDDLVGRYGGEEFCVVLPQVDLEKASIIAERIRKMIERKPCGGVQITVSLGVSSLSQNASKRGELVNQADKALYAAKRGGRNRVVTLGLSNAPESAGQISGGAEPSAIDDSRLATGKQAQLMRRIQDLEGQLEKRNLEFEHYEMYDTKTGLPNRSLFEDRLSLEIMRSKRTKYLVVVMSLTLDMIKRVEETLGYRAAIELVKLCGERLTEVLRKGVDTLAVFEDLEKVSTVSLISQTEFGILLTEIKQIDHVTWVIKRLLDACEKPFQIQDQEIYANASIGVSIFPYDGESAEELHRNAVNACNHAKKTKKNHYFFSSQDINKKAVRQLQIESYLHGALDNNELELYFQPLVKAGTGAIAGFEALLRWQNARLGLVPPDEFIQVAEQSGQIDRIGDWVLHQGCKQMRAWLDGGFEIGWVAINLSGLQLRQRGLADRIRKILDEFNLEPSMLEIELTESSLVEFHDKSFGVLKEIRDLGVRVVMDDFGTGYSSLSYLTNIPLSRIKIDRSFSADIGKNENVEKLIALIVSMAHELGLEVVAEGVEDEQQVDYVTALGCEYLQGYFFGRPMPAAQIAEILEAGRAFRALSEG